MKPYLPPPTPEAQRTSCQLHDLIIHEIKHNNGWIPFSRFMEMALYTPRLGYYTGGSHKIGMEGDFITAPTLTPLFARTIASQLIPLLNQTAGNVYEFGAGTGRLAVDLIKQISDGLKHYYIIELSPELAERQRSWIQAHLSPEFAAKVIWLQQLPSTFDGIILGNEVLDAMPIERIRYKNGIYHQIGVSIKNGQLIEADQPLYSKPLMQSATTYFPSIEDYASELHPAQYAFTRTIADKLKRGGMIWIDYGFDAAQYYHPQRNDGTFIGHYRHHTIHEPFFHIGLTDLTSHVNFTDIAQAATDSGLDLIGYTTQAHFLLNLGITDLLTTIGNIDSTDYLREATAIQQLINPHEMGELFKVIAFGKNIDVDWQGFRFGDLCHKL